MSSPHLQTNKLACQFQDAGTRQTSETETKDIIHGIISSRSLMFTFVPILLISIMGAMQKGQGRYCIYSSFVSQLENIKLKSTQSFHMGYKYTCPTFAYKEGIIFIILVR